MVGGGNRRDEGSFKVSNTNGFAALESLRKKKKSDKEKGSLKGSKGTSKSKDAVEKPPVYWAPAPLMTKSWADVDDEDDDDYYATTAPPQVMWGGSGGSNTEEMQKPDHVEESDSEDELLDEGDYDVDEEHEPEPEEQELHELMLTKPVEVPAAPKETERQLSKKEIKKKELEELDALLADLGVNPNVKAEDEPSDATKESKEEKLNGDAEKNSAPMESKSAKKKKKKDKSSKEVKEPQDQSNISDVPNGQDETAGTEVVEDDQLAVDMKERLKKVAAAKKKKSSKETDASSKAAAEAAARSKRLAAAKKKEKNHYNQQPIR